MCAGLKSRIEGATHAIGKRRFNRLRSIRREEYTRRPVEEEESESLAVGIENLSIETEEDVA